MLWIQSHAIRHSVRLSAFPTNEGGGQRRGVIISGTATVGEPSLPGRDKSVPLQAGVNERPPQVRRGYAQGKGLSAGAEEVDNAGVLGVYRVLQKIQIHVSKPTTLPTYDGLSHRVVQVHRRAGFYAAIFHPARHSRCDGVCHMRGKGQNGRHHGQGKRRTRRWQDISLTLVCYEFYLRGSPSTPSTCYRSDAVRFLTDEEARRSAPPLSPSRIGETAALSIVEQRKGRTCFG
jgi:hypothetical protein